MSKDQQDKIGQDGSNGEDGFSPIANVTEVTNGVKVTITDKNGTTEAVVNNGTNGQDGYTPVKGTDYFTSEDISEIEGDILNQVNQFSIAVVETLPTENIDDHTIYFVPKETEEENDIYDEYIYVNSAWEHIGTTAVGLADYVKNTDYATGSKGGVISPKSAFNTYVRDTDGALFAYNLSYNEYNNGNNALFVNKGTLENVISGKNLADKTYVQNYVDSLNANSVEY